MEEEEFNTDFKRFILPEKFLDRLFDLTGEEEGSRGFIVCFVDSLGNPMVYTKTGNRVTEMGLKKALQEFLDDIEGPRVIDLGEDRGEDRGKEDSS